MAICTICREKLSRFAVDKPLLIIRTDCGHRYHSLCITDWYKRKDNAECPNCWNELRRYTRGFNNVNKREYHFDVRMPYPPFRHDDDATLARVTSSCLVVIDEQICERRVLARPPVRSSLLLHWNEWFYGMFGYEFRQEVVTPKRATSSMEQRLWDCIIQRFPEHQCIDILKRFLDLEVYKQRLLLAILNLVLLPDGAVFDYSPLFQLVKSI